MYEACLHRRLQVIMGSMVLAGGGASSSTVMGSIALCLMKTLSRPLLVVKANATNANIVWDQDKLRAVVCVDHGSRPLLKYMCAKLMNALRSDVLFLARGGATDAHAQVRMCGWVLLLLLLLLRACTSRWHRPAVCARTWCVC